MCGMPCILYPANSTTMTIKDTAGLCCPFGEPRPSCRNPCREIPVHFQEDLEVLVVSDACALFKFHQRKILARQRPHWQTVDGSASC